MIKIIGKDITIKVKKYIQILFFLLTLMDIIFSSGYIYKSLNNKIETDNKVINLAVTKEINEYQKLLQALLLDYQNNYLNSSEKQVDKWSTGYEESFHLQDIGIVTNKRRKLKSLYANSLKVEQIDFSDKDWGVTPVKLLEDKNQYVYAIWQKLATDVVNPEIVYLVLPFETIQDILRNYYQGDDMYSLIIQDKQKIIVAHSYKTEYINSNARNHGEKIIGYSQKDFENHYNRGEIIPFLSYSQAKGVCYWNTYSWIENTNWMLLTRINLNSYLEIFLVVFILKIILFFFVTRKIRKLLNKKIYRNTFSLDRMLNKNNKIIGKSSSGDSLDKLLQYSVGSIVDEQTGALRKEVFMMRAQEKLLTTQKQSYIFFIDLDNLKFINDSLGHNYGDLVINLFYKKIIKIFQGQDILIGRFGGDEFLLYVHDMVKEDLLNLLKDINLKLRVSRKGIVYSASIGIAIYPEHSRNLNELISFADKALYKAKEVGKNNYKIYS